MAERTGMPNFPQSMVVCNCLVTIQYYILKRKIRSTSVCYTEVSDPQVRNWFLESWNGIVLTPLSSTVFHYGNADSQKLLPKSLADGQSFASKWRVCNNAPTHDDAT